MSVVTRSNRISNFSPSALRAERIAFAVGENDREKLVIGGYPGGRTKPTDVHRWMTYCLDFDTGKIVWEAGGLTMNPIPSPVAADGRIYLSNEDGDIIVVRAGPKYEELAKNAMGEVIMSTPAISAGTIIVRTLGHVYGVGR